MAQRSRARRPLVALLAIVIAMAGALAAGTIWKDAAWTPKLALDLDGGTQIILTPKLNPGEKGTITTQTISQAIEIIRQRVDSSGVAEAEISSQGGQNIVVALPGDPAEQAEAIRLVSQSAQMRFRPVLVESAGAPIDPNPTDPNAIDPNAIDPNAIDPNAIDPNAVDPNATPVEPQPAETPATEPTDGAAPTPIQSTSGRALPYLQSTAPAEQPVDPNQLDPNQLPIDPGQLTTDPAAGMPTTAATGTPSDLAQITEELGQQFYALDCTKAENRAGGIVEDPTKVLVTCSQDGAAKYILGPVEVEGARIKSADSGMATNSQGASTGEWAVNLAFDGEGAKQFRTVTTRLVGLQQPQNQFAIVLDGLVVSAPRTNAVISDGKAQITGSFTQESAAQLANQLKFGALPMSFTVQSSEQISALLGSEQLKNGMLAGLVGLILVVIYSLLQYRALGMVTVASLVVAGVLTYLSICLLSWTYGYRLSLPGVCGLIIAIGVTADSFIVYFERIRDEVREGRTLVAAVETGWARARQTIIASDAINLLAAVVLYLLAVGGVRGFAFTLGLTTILDLVIVMLFTHPMVTILARTKFFGGGHPLSGFDAEHLGRSPAYAGRGRVRSEAERAPTIAERKAAERKAARAAEDGGDPPIDDESVAAGPNLTKES